MSTSMRSFCACLFAGSLVASSLLAACAAAPLPAGDPCTAATACDSGFCVDGVCCDTACEGACEACNGVETAGAAGTCSPVSEGADPAAECEAGVESCRPGTCNGQRACGVATDGTACRPADGACDVAETCASGVCPAEAVADKSVLCRASAGDCDVAEQCSGDSATCPSNVFLTSLCREANGECDAPESCDGVNAQCPANGFQPATAVCASSQFYLCPGNSGTCPTSCATNTSCNAGRQATCHDAKRCHNGKWAFVTSTASGGNLGGLSGADATCTTRARAAGLGGTYRAWIADADASPNTRFSKVELPIYLLNGVKLAEGWSGLIVNIPLRANFEIDENGNAVAASNVWTNVLHFGGNPASTDGHCVGWTSSAAGQFGNVGVTNAINNTWTRGSSAQGCERLRRIFCFEQ